MSPSTLISAIAPDDGFKFQVDAAVISPEAVAGRMTPQELSDCEGTGGDTDASLIMGAASTLGPVRMGQILAPLMNGA